MISKVLTAVAFGAALAVVQVTPQPAQASDRFVGGLAGGLIGGLMAGAIIASQQQAGAPRGYRRRVAVRGASARSRRAPSGGPGESGQKGQAVVNVSADPFAKPSRPATTPVSINR